MCRWSVLSAPLKLAFSVHYSSCLYITLGEENCLVILDMNSVGNHTGVGLSTAALEIREVA